MHQEFSFETPFAPITTKLIFGIPLFLLSLVAYFDPIQLLIHVKDSYPFIHYCTLIVCISIFILIINTSLTTAVSKIIIESEQLILFKEGLFSNGTTEVHIEAKHLYYLKHSPNVRKKTLITRNGHISLYSAEGLQSLSAALKEAFFNKREFYEQLADEDIYDIYHSLPSGKQAELVREVMNNTSDENKNERIKELLAPVGGKDWQLFHEPDFTPTCELIHGLTQCPSCQSENISRGEINDQYYTHIKPSDYALPVRESFLGNSYPRLSPKIEFCRECGFAWSQIQLEIFKQQYEEYSAPK